MKISIVYFNSRIESSQMAIYNSEDVERITFEGFDNVDVIYTFNSFKDILEGEDAKEPSMSYRLYSHFEHSYDEIEACVTVKCKSLAENRN